jgi:hypothetical protein
MFLQFFYSEVVKIGVAADAPGAAASEKMD